VAFLMTGTYAMAYSVTFSVNGIKYSYNLDDGNYYFAGVDDATVTSITIPKQVLVPKKSGSVNGQSYNISGYHKIYGIRSTSLSECTNLNSVVFDGSFVFEGSVVIPSSLHKVSFRSIADLYNCSTTKQGLFSSIDSLLIDGILTRDIIIDTAAVTNINTILSGCGFVESVTLGSNVKTIGNNAFSGCKALKTVNLNEGLTTIGNNAFSQCESLKTVTFPTSLSVIGSSAFNKCQLLESVEFKEGLSSIGENAFINCVLLKSVSLPKSISVVGDYAFKNCTSLESVTMKECSSATIGEYAFYDCTSLSTFVMAEGLKSIGRSAFFNCLSLKEVDFPSTFTTLGDDAFAHSGLVEVDISSNMRGIGEYCFYDCKNLRTATIAEGLYSISEGMFSGCTSLVDVSLPSSLTTINESAFYGCESLESIILPSKLMYIKADVFRNCSSLKYVNIPSVKTFGKSVFIGCDNLKVFGPSGYGANVEYSFTQTFPDNFFSYANVSYFIIPSTIKSFGTSSDGFYGANIYTVYYTGFKSQWESLITNNKDVIGSTFTNRIVKYNYGNIQQVYYFKNGVTYMITDINNCKVCVCQATNIPNYSGNIRIPKTVLIGGKYYEVTSIADGTFPTAATVSGISFEGTRQEWESILIGGNNQSLVNSYINFNAGSEKNNGQNMKNALYVDPSSLLYRGNGSKLNICLKNNADWCGCQFELELPAGFEIQTDDDNRPCYLVNPNRIAKSDAIVSIRKLSDGRYVILCSSASNKSFQGLDGCVISFPMTISDNLAVQDYNFVIRKAVVTNDQSTISSLPVTGAKILLAEAVPGDANGDGEINVSDFTAIASRIMGNPPASFVEKAADVNEDGEINVGDLTGVATIILHGSQKAPMRENFAVGGFKEPSISANDCFVTEGQEFTVDVRIGGSQNFSGYQFDMMLPEGLTAKSCESASVKPFFSSSIVGEKTLRVLSASTNGTPVRDDDDCVARITLVANAELNQPVCIDNVMISQNGSVINVAPTTFKVSASGTVTNVEDYKSAQTPVEVYDLLGRRISADSVESLDRGIYIVNGKKFVK